MLQSVSEDLLEAFREACAQEHVFGARCVTALEVYGVGSKRARFWIDKKDGRPAQALYLGEGVLTVVSNQDADAAALAALVRETGAREIHTTLELCESLHVLLGGWKESSWFMAYEGEGVEGDFAGLEPASDLWEIFDLLRKSHPHYREHLEFGSWSADSSMRMEKNLSEVYHLKLGGKIIGTGSITCMDDQVAVIGNVAVLPQYRGRGLGGHISGFLVNRILEKRLRPVLISGYDAVAALYRRVGFHETGRWGQLFL